MSCETDNGGRGEEGLKSEERGEAEGVKRISCRWRRCQLKEASDSEEP